MARCWFKYNGWVFNPVSYVALGGTPTLNLSPNVGTEKTVAPFWYHSLEYCIVHSSGLPCLSMVHVWSGKVASTPPVGHWDQRPPCPGTLPEHETVVFALIKWAPFGISVSAASILKHNIMFKPTELRYFRLAATLKKQPAPSHTLVWKLLGAVTPRTKEKVKRTCFWSRIKPGSWTITLKRRNTHPFLRLNNHWHVYVTFMKRMTRMMGW